MHSFLEVVFADDLNAFRSFPLAIPNTELTNESRKCQQELHAWGRASQVEFDPKKESIHVVSHFCPEGKNFKILGLDFDCRLTMGDAIAGLVSEMGWRVRSVLRPRRYQTTVGMMNLYKSKVLSYAEYRTSAIYHACASSLEAIDRVQGRFLEELGVDKWHAFMVFNLAPLSLRRGIALLGLICISSVSFFENRSSNGAVRNLEGTHTNCMNIAMVASWTSSRNRRWGL